MPKGTSTTAIDRPDLGTIAWEYSVELSQQGFIGMQVMPLFPVPEKSAQYPIIPVESLLKIPDTKRAPRANYARADWEFDTSTYSCHENGWEEQIPDAEANLYRRFFDAEMVATTIATNYIMLGHEKRVADKVMNTSNAIGTTAVASEWSDAANATPKADVKLGIQAMRAACGLKPNALIMSLTVMENLLITQELLDYLKFTTPHLVEGMEAQKATLGRYFGVDMIMVGDAISDTAKRGKSKVISDVWSNEFVSLCRVSSGELNLREASFGRTFLWEEDSPEELVTESYRDEPKRSDIVRVRQNTDEAIVFKGANYLLSNIT